MTVVGVALIAGSLAYLAADFRAFCTKSDTTQGV